MASGAGFPYKVNNTGAVAYIQLNVMKPIAQFLGKSFLVPAGIALGTEKDSTLVVVYCHRPSSHFLQNKCTLQSL
jgi:hypothetical protein